LQDGGEWVLRQALAELQKASLACYGIKMLSCNGIASRIEVTKTQTPSLETVLIRYGTCASNFWSIDFGDWPEEFYYAEYRFCFPGSPKNKYGMILYRFLANYNIKDIL
jgi:hypothetical protein